MTVPTFTTGRALGAGAVDRLDEAIDTLYYKAMSYAVPMLEVWVEGNKHSKRGYVIHMDAFGGVSDYLVYDLLLNGLNSPTTKAIKLSYAGTTLFVFDGSDAAHGAGTNCRVQGALSLYNFPTAGTHPADGDVVTVDIERYNPSDTDLPAAQCDGDIACCVYDLHEERSIPDGYTHMTAADELADGDDTDVPTALQVIASNVIALEALAGRRPGFVVRERDAFDATALVIGPWYWHTNNGGWLYYKIGLSKPLLVGPADATATVTLYAQVLGDGSPQTLVAIHKGGGCGVVSDVEGTTSLSTVTRNVNDLCKVWAEVKYHMPDGSTPRDGSARATIYMLKEEIGAGGSAAESFLGVEADDAVTGDSGTNRLQNLWKTVRDLLAADSGGGYGTNGYDIDGGFPAGYALMVARNPVMFGGDQVNELPGAVMRAPVSIGFIKAGDFLWHKVKGDVELIYTDVDGEEASQALEVPDPEEDEATQEDHFVLDLSELQELADGAYYRVRTTTQVELPQLYGAWEGDAI